MDQLEITGNPGILANAVVPITDIKLFGLKLFDDSRLLKIEDVDIITLVKFPDQAKQLFGFDKKNWLYEINGHQQVFTFEQQYLSAMENGGCLHMNNNVTYVIDEQKIIGMKLYNSIHGIYDITIEEIERTFGNADKIEERYFDVDDSLASTEFIYFSRPMTISVDAINNRISTIHFGKLPFSLGHQREKGQSLL